MSIHHGRALHKLRAEKLRDDDRKALQAIRERMKVARSRRAVALKRATQLCRRARLKLRARVAAFRTRELARLRAEVLAMRSQARQQCQSRKCKIRKAGGGLVERSREHLKAERRLQAQLARIATAATRKAARAAAPAKVRRQEDDDHVRGNIPRELIPVFDRVAKSIKGGPRTTRTEAFLQWAEEHPEDICSTNST